MSSTESLSDEESLPPCNGTAGKYGYLVVDDEWHEIAVGETKIGRDASICSIVLREATLSMLHAVIESEGPEDSFIYDANSSNKTKIGKMRLKPFCRYKISDNDTIIMGNKIIQYKVVDNKIKNCKTESSSNILKLCMSDEKENLAITEKNKANVLDVDENLVLSTEEQGNNLHVPKISLSAPEKISNKPLQSYYILASELFNTDIFSQATQCDIKNESFKASSTEIVDSNDDNQNMETHCGHFSGIDKAESELKLDKEISENINKIRESYFDDSATFDLVRKNENKYLLASSFCKSISDDIFELPTQLQSEMYDSQKVLVDKDNNFKNCFSSRSSGSDKSEEDHASDNKIESEKNSCERETENHSSRDVDPEFFDDDRDEELCEIMRAISPGINDNNECILSQRGKLSDNNRLKESKVPDECCEIQNPFGFGLCNSENSNQSENESLPLDCSENERSELVQTNERGNELKNSEQALRSSLETCSLTAQKMKKCITKCSPDRELPKGEGDSLNYNRENSDGNISKIRLEDKKIYNQETRKNSGGNPSPRTYSLNSGDECDGSQGVYQEDQCIRRESEIINDEYESDSGVRLHREDVKEMGKELKSPLVNETLNEVWEKQSKGSPASSNKTLSDLDISEFQGNYVTALGSDSEEDFISTQGLCSLNKSNGGKPGVKNTRSKLDIWKENWQDFIFTQHLSNEKREKSESESTDKTESDIVISTKPIPNVGHSEIIEMPDREGFFDIDDHSNESECLIKNKIGFEGSPNRDAGLVEEDSDEVICESPVLLQPNIQTENFQDSEQKIPMKSEGESVTKEYEPNRNGVVSESDETDCEDELKIRKLPFPSNRGKEVFPSTSDLKGKKFRETKQIAKDVPSEKRDSSPLKRMMKSDKDVILPKKRSKSIRKKKESGDVGGRQLRSRSAKASGERYQSENGKSNDGVKGSCRKQIVNTDVTSAKKLDVVLEKSLSECDGLESGCSENRWQPRSVRIVFTGFESESHNRIISRLGGSRVNDFKEGNVLVTDKVRRTVKFLSAVALGLPIVSPKWLLSSNKELKFLDPWHFLLEDDDAEERWGFNLRTSLEKWRKEKLLQGFNVFATKNTKPPVPEILSIVECCGGMSFASYPEVWPEKSIVLTCVEDKKSWPHYRFRNVKIVHYEFLLSGVLKHAMDFKTYKLR